MSKYDFEIDLSETTSTGIILKKIKPGSCVLEFGCATGRMTRYMKEILNCSVYIVELEQAAFDEAMQYAEDGICDDIMTLSWVEKFSDINFDVVIFADVLEHLSNPGLALSNVKKVLKEDGLVYISIPNITHNDILLKAFYNHFDYTKIGLLDDTHTHFWGFENIEPFVSECGLSIFGMEATYCKTGCTEQYAEETLSAPQMLLNYFNERGCGEIYQFVLTLGKKGKGDYEIKRDFMRPYIKSHVYYDDGTGFNENDIYEFESEFIAPGQYLAHFVLNNVEGVRRIRFDPVELQSCILQYLSIRQAGKELTLGYSECVEIENGVLILSEDPMVFADIDSSGGPVVIEADIIISGDEYEKRIQSACVNKQSELEELKNRYAIEKNELQGRAEQLAAEAQELHGKTEQLNTEKEELRVKTETLTAEAEHLTLEKAELQGRAEQLAAEKEELRSKTEQLEADTQQMRNRAEQLDADNKRLQESINQIESENNRLTDKNREQQKTIGQLTAEKESMSVDLSAYIVCSNNKDLLLIKEERRIRELENGLSGREQRIRELENDLSGREQRIRELEERVAYYDNRFCVRVCNKAWKIYWKIRNKIFRRNK